MRYYLVPGVVEDNLDGPASDQKLPNFRLAGHAPNGGRAVPPHHGTVCSGQVDQRRDYPFRGQLDMVSLQLLSTNIVVVVVVVLRVRSSSP